MSEKISLDEIWNGIKVDAGVSPVGIESARTQLLAQTESNRDEYAFKQANTQASLGNLATVIEWVDAEDKLPEEKLARAKYLVAEVHKANLKKSQDIGTYSVQPNEILTRITSALEDLGRQRN